MKLLLRSLLAALLVPVLHAEPEVAAETNSNQQAAGAELWEDFQKNYKEYSFSPLPADELDLKARKALLTALGTRYRSWEPDKAPSLPELIEAVHKNDPASSTFDLAEKALTALLPTIDRFGLYESSSEIAQLQEASRQSGGQIAMIVERDDNGRLLCFPEPEGPASEAGINYGSELLEVDGVSVERKRLAAVKLAFIGPSPSVSVKIRQPQGKEETLSIKRTTQVFPSVSAKKGPTGLSVRIRKFDSGSASRFKALLQENAPVTRLILDLRGNPGGLRDEAMLAASLFTPEKTVLGRLKDGQGERDVSDGNGVFCEPQSIQILQDRRSASGAEFLAASLRENLPGKVKIFGEPSYGKSHSTVKLPLYGGGIMTVSESLMMTASGKSWDKTGLQPDVVQQSK
ncbi:MAG: S41 family peptidase [Luteolibacter sp.]